MRACRLLSRHAAVLVEVARDPRANLGQIAFRARVTERHVQRLIDDLDAAGYLSRVREGKGNRYTVHRDTPLARPARGGTVGALLDLLDPSD